jgi:hypothetical protein
VIYLPKVIRPISMGVGANQHVDWFLGGKGLGIQQGTSVWVSSLKSKHGLPIEVMHLL